MTPLLAELPSTDSPQAVGWVVLIFFGIMGGLYYTINVWRHLGGKSDKTVVSPQPLEVRESHAFATRPELSELSKRMDDELGRERGARKKIHEEIGALQSSVAAIKTENQKQTSDLAEVKQDIKDMNARVDLVPERTINLLKTTGVIK